MIRLPLRSAALIAAALSITLAGCVSVLPKSKPSQLYSFVKSEAAVPADTTTQKPTEIGLLLGGLNLPRSAAGDGILTRTGTEAAYIGEARWISPAVLLFREATENTFGRSGALHLISRGEVGKASAILRLEVREFEARYPERNGIPTVLVTVEARLNGADGTFVDARRFTAQTKASDNRVGPIVDAFSASTDKVLSDAAAWALTQAQSLPVPAGPPVRATAATTTRETSTSTTTQQR